MAHAYRRFQDAELFVINPAENLLYRVVTRHLETFLARQRERDRNVPGFVESEFRSFLDCGVLARGFIRVHCSAAHWTVWLGSVAKGGVFAIAVVGGWRDTAAHLVYRIFPRVPVRQWVLSFPHALRYRLAHDSDLNSDTVALEFLPDSDGHRPIVFSYY